MLLGQLSRPICCWVMAVVAVHFEGVLLAYLIECSRQGYFTLSLRFHNGVTAVFSSNRLIFISVYASSSDVIRDH